MHHGTPVKHVDSLKQGHLVYHNQDTVLAIDTVHYGYKHIPGHLTLFLGPNIVSAFGYVCVKVMLYFCVSSVVCVQNISIRSTWVLYVYPEEGKTSLYYAMQLLKVQLPNVVIKVRYYSLIKTL